MACEDELRSRLQRIDGRGYKAYKDLRGHFELGDLSPHVDHVQGDPFAAPSRLRLRLPMERARLPGAWFSSPVEVELHGVVVWTGQMTVETRWYFVRVES